MVKTLESGLRSLGAVKAVCNSMNTTGSKLMQLLCSHWGTPQAFLQLEGYLI